VILNGGLARVRISRARRRREERVATSEDTERDDSATSAKDEESRRRGILAAIALAVLFFLVLWWLLSRYAAVPDVVGLPEQRATDVIESAGFVVGTVIERSSVEGRAGEVVEQSPGAGSRALRGTAVDLFVAEGEPAADDTDAQPGMDDVSLEWGAPTSAPRPIAPASPTDRRPRVPQALGLTEGEATALMRSAGYRITVDYGPSTTAVPRGNVFYQEPPPDTVAARGSTVSIWVSTGSPIPGANQPRP
jgi:eukaryotic-like serine/threonine-protein kinase